MLVLFSVYFQKGVFENGAILFTPNRKQLTHRLPHPLRFFDMFIFIKESAIK